MTPEEREEFNLMKSSVEALLEWKLQKTDQQITYPIDEASKNTLGALTVEGTGNANPDETINVPSTPATFQVPASPSGTLLVRGQDGAIYELLKK